MYREIFLIIGVVGIGVITNGLKPIPAGTPVRGESNTSVANIGSRAARRRTRGTGAVKTDAAALNGISSAGRHKAVMIASNAMPAGRAVAAGNLALPAPIRDGNMAVARFSALAAVPHSTSGAHTPALSGDFFLDIHTVVRWLSLIALSTFMVVLYKAFVRTPTSSATMNGQAVNGGPNSQIHGL